MMPESYVDTPTVTSNALLLLGFITGVLDTRREGNPYKAHRFEPEKGTVIIEHENGNRYCVRVEQISGIE